MARRPRVKPDLSATPDVTWMPGMPKPHGVAKTRYPLQPTPPAKLEPPFVPEPATKHVDLDKLLEWIASAGTERDVTPLLQFWNQIAKKLSKIGVKGNRHALKELPSVTDVPNFNGKRVSTWIDQTDDIESLQKVFAALRLRVRHANWLSRR